MWNNNTYFYSKRQLKNTATIYTDIYLTLPMSEKIHFILDVKIDFDRALNAIGRGAWTGEISDFKYYRHFGKLQRLIIADILHIEDYELERMRYRYISKLRSYAYYQMTLFLNNTDKPNPSLESLTNSV